ncbi:Piso0_000365 [Millerozyma farinosa CBS 7064]|uniref:U1 small nuclear ribonucleoprotein component SNU71 n=1 Tax=Pichia sorbitophila (strain ATCC MYA-4447 / BCRC 22081 / CBS 7064 / NBRC 10061 / NRRL Y-12695) TaxID=559304 RepID=G8YV88_PICSO|nr:Piso0_000365 [Millerozyma farinosa CBS 7064]CCE73332.1 Piso0_000365 [Millerozyma farinosa CBS 7064]
MAPRNMGNYVNTVSPFSVPSNNHHGLLSQLKCLANYPEFDQVDEKELNKVIQSIPVSKEENTDQIIESNSYKIYSGENSSRRSTGHKIQGNHNAEEQSDETDNEDDAKLSNFIELEKFLPQSFKDQLTTVVVKNFPNLRLALIEKVFKNLLTSCPVNSSFDWSLINIEHIDHKVVFIRFHHVNTTVWFYKNIREHLQESIQGINITFDSNLESDIANMKEFDSGAGSIQRESLQVDLQKILLNNRNYENVSKIRGMEDLDQAMQYYSSYKVDPSELIDVPKDMQDKIVDEIVKFRSKVLSIERERRKQEIERERILAKNRLQRIFEGTKEAGDEMIIDDIEAVQAIQDDKQEISEYENLTEEEYISLIEQKEKEALENTYNEKVEIFSSKELNERNRLREEHQALREYETSLIEKKAAFIGELKSFQDYKLDDLDQYNNLDRHKIKLYYTEYSEYLRLRAQEKAEEENRDKKDIDEEALELSASNNAQNFLSSFKTELKPSRDVEQNTTTDVIVSSLDKATLDKVKTKIGDLIEEYLGVKEDVLIEYVYDFVITNNLTKQNELVEELSETLDEDSVTVVSKLYDYIAELSKFD